MSKKKHKKTPRRKPQRFVHPSDPYLEDESYDYRDEALPLDDALEEDEFAFDFERWRDDLAARSLHRERMRKRDLKRGILDSDRVAHLPLEADEPDDDL